MTMIKLVPEELLQQDPKQLIYHERNKIFNSPYLLIRAIDKIKKHFYYKNVNEIEIWANKNGLVMLPAATINWYQKEKMGLQDKDRIKVGRRHFYLVPRNKLSEKQIKSVKKHIEIIRLELEII